MLLAILLAQLVTCYHILVVHNQCVAENCRPVQLFHQRLCKLVKGVGEDNCLGKGAELVHKSFGAFQGLHCGNHILNVLERKAMFLENLDSSFHKNIVVGNVPGGEPEFFDSSLLSYINPDFRY